METIIEMMWKPKTSLLLVEMFFWLVKNSFFSTCQIFLAVKAVFQSSENVFFNEFFISASGNGFSVK